MAKLTRTEMREILRQQRDTAIAKVVVSRLPNTLKQAKIAYLLAQSDLLLAPPSEKVQRLASLTDKGAAYATMMVEEETKHFQAYLESWEPGVGTGGTA